MRWRTLGRIGTIILTIQLAVPVWLIPTPALAAGETLSFLSSPRYVRENNGGDIAAQVLVTNTANSVDFYIDGAVTPVSTSTVVAGAAAGYEWYRLKTPLTAGQHTLTAIANISGGGTVASSNTGIVYSIDTPAVSYIIPSASRAVFRSSDNPLRAEVDDEFNQFNRAIFTISNGGGVVGTYTVNRAQCDLREAGRRVLCDVNDSSTWVPLIDGNYTAKVTTYTQANNRADNIPSLPFIVDNTRPVLSAFTVDSPLGAATYRDSITVSANASHIVGIKKVDFWVTNTESRPSGPVCTGNGAQLTATAVTSPDGDGKYRGVLATGALNGQYCLNAAAESLSNGHSTPIATQMVMIDNIVPATTLSAPHDGLVTNDPITISGSSSDNQQVAALHLYYRFDGTPGWTPLKTLTNSTPGTPFGWAHDWTPSLDGTYDLKASAEDVAGNVEASAYAEDIVYDTTAPILTEVTPVPTPDNDLTPDYSFSSDEAGVLSYGGSCSSAATVATTGVNTIELNSLVDGTYTGCTVTVTDEAGNSSLPLPISTFIIDTVTPSSTMDLSGSVTNSTVNMHGVATDAVSLGTVLLQYKLSSDTVWSDIDTITASGMSYEWSYGWVPPTDGTYDLRAVTTDTAGNVATGGDIPVVDAVTYDKINPTVAITATTPVSGDIIRTDFTISGTAGDSLSGISSVALWWSPVGAGTWSLLATPAVAAGTWSYTFRPASAGYYDFEVRGADLAGNIATPNTATNLGFDRTTPTGSITAPIVGSWYNSSFSLTGTALDNLAGIDRVRARWGASGQPWQLVDLISNYNTGTGVWSLTVAPGATLANGLQQVRVELRDAANNTRTINLNSIGYDTEPSTGLWSNVPTNNVLSFDENGGSYDFHATATDGFSGVKNVWFVFTRTSDAVVQYQPLATLGADWSATVASANLPEGTYTVSVVVEDNASNMTTVDTDSLTVDNSDPTVAITAPLASSYQQSVPTVSGTAADNGSPAVGITSVEVEYKTTTGSWVALGTATVSGGVWSLSGAALVPNETYELRVTGADLAGNSSTSSIAGVVIDTIQPSFSSINVTSDNTNTSIAKISDTVTVTFTSSEILAANPVVTIGGQSMTFTGLVGATYTYARTIDGTETQGAASPISISGADLSGNTGVASSSFDLDFTPPDITILLPTTAATHLTNLASLDISGSANDTQTVATVQSSVAGVVSGTTSWSQTVSLVEGVNPITYTAVDAAGNQSTDTITVTRDSNSPTFTINNVVSDNVNPAVATDGDKVTLTFTSSETLDSNPTVTIGGQLMTIDTANSSGLNYTYTRQIDKTEVESLTSPIEISGVDLVGNSGSGSGSFVIDYSNPTAAWSNPAPGTAHQLPLTVSGTASDSLSGLASVIVQLRAADSSLAGSFTATTATSWSATVSGLTDGRYTVYLVVSDNAGNTFTSASQGEVVIDTTAPATTMSSPSSNIFVNSPLTIIGTSTDAIAVGSVRLYYSVAGADSWNLITTITNPTPGTSYSWSTSWSPSTEGNYDIKAAATDTAGNQEHSAYVRNVTYDTTAPTVVETQIIKNGALVTALTVGDVVTVRARVTDTYGVKTLASLIENSASGKSLGSITLTAVGNNWYEGPFTVPATYTDGTAVAAADGRWTIGATDKAGNYTFSWSGFTVRPVITTTTATRGATAGGTTGGQGGAQPAEDITTAASIPAENPQTLDGTPEVAGASTSKDEAMTRNLTWLWLVLGLGIVGGAGYWFWLRRFLADGEQF